MLKICIDKQMFYCAFKRLIIVKRCYQNKNQFADRALLAIITLIVIGSSAYL